MTDLSPWAWYLAGFASFITIAVISYVLLDTSRKRRSRPIEEHEDEFWRGQW